MGESGPAPASGGPTSDGGRGGARRDYGGRVLVSPAGEYVPPKASCDLFPFLSQGRSPVASASNESGAQPRVVERGHKKRGDRGPCPRSILRARNAPSARLSNVGQARSEKNLDVGIVQAVEHHAPFLAVTDQP